MGAASAYALVNSFTQCSNQFTSSRCSCSCRSFPTRHSQPRRNINGTYNSVKTKKMNSRISAVAEVSGLTSDPAQAVVTWQIVVGALAGVTPFMVAGIEFGKRIVKQRQCGECKGSGLVLRNDQQYIRCPGCGGWLPWQSWRRFFTG